MQHPARNCGKIERHERPGQNDGRNPALAAEHFKVPRDQLNPDDDFFKKLGINSLQALDLLTRIEQHFQIELPDYELQGVTRLPHPRRTDSITPVMLDLRQYNSLGEALRAALDRWPNEICLIEADRDRENARLTYRQFKEQALPLASALQDAGLKDGTRAAIIMTNQSKWLISAYAIFFCGGVLVPLDYKLTAAEHLQLLAHSNAEFLVIEYHLWRAITQAEQFKNLATRDRPRDRSAAKCRSSWRTTLGRISRHSRTNYSPRASAKTRPASSIRPAPADARKAAS